MSYETPVESTTVLGPTWDQCPADFNWSRDREGSTSEAAVEPRQSADQFTPMHQLVGRKLISMVHDHLNMPATNLTRSGER